MNAGTPIKLLLADDHVIVLDGLVALLQTETDLEVTSTAGNGGEVLALAAQQRYDVCLLDINMPGMDGIETAGKLRQQWPGIKIIILTTYGEKEIVTRLLQTGVEGYLLKNSSRQELLSAIRKVASGGYYFSDEVHATILSGYNQANKTSAGPPVTLTQREKEILTLLSREYTNEKIASVLHISFRTVETHRKNMMQKTGASNLAGLLRYAYHNGLLN